MQQILPAGAPPPSAPSFYLTGRQPLRPAAILLAIVAVIVLLSIILYGMAHSGHLRAASSGSGADRSASPSSSGANSDDDDDPNQIDTIVLGDPADAPSPGKRGDHVSPVHPTIVVRLPRFGDEVGLIPDSPAGRLLYAWLAAFNQADPLALANALPNVANEPAAAAQIQLRQRTGGFNLVSAKEVQPGVLVFRLRDQSPLGIEVLGTLQSRSDTIPASIASFSLRAIPPPPQHLTPGLTPAPAER